MKYFKLIIVAVMLVFTSCEQLFFEDDLSSTNPKDNFEYLWNQCNEKYAYFDVKGIDWNAVKTKYSSKIYDGMSDDSLFNTLGAMLKELKDDHTNLISNFNVSIYGVNYKHQDNFEWRTVVDNYITPQYISTGPFIHNFIANGTIGYIRFSSFTGTVDAINLDYVLNKYKDTRGLILDLRENGGGAVTDVFSLLSRFVEQNTVVYYSRIKNGKAHDAFSEAKEAEVTPYEGIRYKNKVAVLVDRGTYSAGSFTSLATKAIPNLILVGDSTGGGLGLPNGGQLPNGWTYRFSITQSLTLDKNPNYERGVPPDVKVAFDWTDMKTDEIIDKAIEILNED